MQKYAKIGEIRAAQRDPSDLGRGSVLWAKVRTRVAEAGRRKANKLGPKRCSPKRRREAEGRGSVRGRLEPKVLL